MLSLGSRLSSPHSTVSTPGYQHSKHRKRFPVKIPLFVHCILNGNSLHCHVSAPLQLDFHILVDIPPFTFTFSPVI